VLPEVVGALQSEGATRVPLDSASDMLDMFDGESDVLATLRESPVAKKVSLVGELDTTELTDWLTRNVFSDANHEGDGVYRLPPTLFCPMGFDPVTGAPTGTVEAECADLVTRIKPRIRARGDASELEFSLLIGPSSNEPFFLTLTKKSMKLAVDLGEGADAVAELSGILGEQAPNLRASGRVSSSVAVQGPKHVVFAASVEKAMSLAFADQGVALDSADAFRLSSAAAQVYTVTIDGGKSTLSAAVALGETKVHTPSTDLDEPKMDLDLPGLTGTVTVTPGQPVKFTGIGLGNRTMTVDSNGVRALSVDLNPQHNRRFDVTVTEEADKVTFAVSPAIDLRVQIDRAKLQEPVRPFEVTQFLLDGTNPTLELRATSLKLSSGHLRVTTNPAEYGVEANAGQCLGETAVGVDYSKLVIVACPL
jgi:hypothetical protein